MLHHTAPLGFWVAALAVSTTGVAALPQFISAVGTRDSPQIRLDQGTFAGVRNGTVDRFLGIQYAKPPRGDLRFRLPVANDPYTGAYNATSFGPSCIQQNSTFVIPDVLDPQAKAVLEGGFGVFTDVSDDCLSVNVYKPSDVAANGKLPVVIWIHGGGFEVGGSSGYDGSVIVQRSIDLGEPIIYVSLNYRLGAYGFLNGAEVEAAGVANLGLQDQRQAFRWVQKYINIFGGDRSKVTIWGQSAGGASVGLHLVANEGNTEGLFHAAFMESGFPMPNGDTRQGQRWYDLLVKQSGCAGATDTLSCIRDTVPDEVINAIQDKTPYVFSRESLNLTWTPRADGNFLQDLPFQAVLNGKIANVPFITGDTDDEGTLFTVSLTDITTNEGAHTYIASNYFPNATAAEIDQLLEFYPEDPAQGSPFNTGNANAVTPEFKRLAAVQGDFFFHGPRRFLLQHHTNKQPVWSYLSKRSKSLPDLGSFHITDLNIIYSPGDLTDYLINFVNHHDPNGRGNVTWPQYTSASPTLLTLLDGATPITLEEDDFRIDAIKYLDELLLKYPS